jgi:putative ABC transport system permease protein
MTRHLVRLIWNRKRQNLLLTIEILCSFLVVFVVMLAGLNFTVNARKSLGFSVDRVWSIDIGRPPGPPGEDKGPEAEAARALERDTVLRLVAAARELPQVEQVSAAFTAPYVNSSWGMSLHLQDGRNIDFLYDRVTDDFTSVFSMPIVAGRGFTREDDAGAADPVLINVEMAHRIFGDANPIGQIIPERQEPNRRRPTDTPAKPKRVAGVIEEFRQHGKYSMPEAVLIDRMRLDVAEGGRPERLLIRVRPGTSAAFEPTLVRRLQREAADWSFDISTMERLRERKHSDYLMPLTVLAVLAGFLLLMVTLGLTGVVWQSVIQRLHEFGLRRAAGASGVAVRGQVMAEMAVMTTFALLAGVALVAQIPFLPLPEDLVMPSGVFLGAIALSTAAIYCLTLACGWYPSRLASRMPPAEALRYE